ncbi:MAG: PD-(D/E)XK nuclease family protein [bacterium]|nr:PD-(D/E)XK nuclease family protein [bacterium]
MQSERIPTASGQSLWETACAKVIELSGGDIWNLPIWLLGDGRHRQAAEIALMHRLGLRALPTGTIKTFTSLAAEILGLNTRQTLATTADAAILFRELPATEFPEIYRSSSRSPGFVESFWSALLDAEERGHFIDQSHPAALPPQPPTDFRALQCIIHERLKEHRLFTPSELFILANQALLEGHGKLVLDRPVVVGPILTLNIVQKEFLRTLRGCVTDLILFQETESTPNLVSSQASELGASTQPRRILYLKPRTPDDEWDTVLSKIAEWVADGKYNYSDFRIIHPFASDERPAASSAAQRYQVPLKSRISGTLIDFPGAVLLNKLLELFETGWRKTDLLEILRSRLLNAPPQEVSLAITALTSHRGSRFVPADFPWQTLFANWDISSLRSLIEQLRLLDEQGKAVNNGASFNRWMKQCILFLRRRLGEFPDDIQEIGFTAGEEEAGWQALEEVLDKIATLATSQGSRGSFIETFRETIQLESYLTVEHRRDAVELCPANREDHLPVPVVFLISLNSRYPKAGKLQPFLNHTVSAGYQEQIALFNLLMGNATEKVLLSCPEYDNQGDKLAISPLLYSLRLDEPNTEPWEPWHPFSTEINRRPKYSNTLQHTVPEAGGYLKFRNKRWSVSQIDKALQCRYLHFAADLLGLRPSRDRSVGMTAMNLGEIMHTAVQMYVDQCTRGIPFDGLAWCREKLAESADMSDPHLESDRAAAELLRTMQLFIDNGWECLLPEFRPLRLELPFGRKDAELPPLDLQYLELEGQIDRLDVDRTDRVIVVDYKYQKSDVESRNEFFEALDSGMQPQLVFYGMVVQDLLHKQPVAWLKVYLRSGVIRGVKLTETLSDELDKSFQMNDIDATARDLMLTNSKKKLLELVDAVTRGDVTPRPTDFNRCGPGRCDFADLCRYRTRWMP